MKLVSDKLRRSARGQACTLRLRDCNGDTATTVLAHVPCGTRGMGMKGLDLIACFACSSCHDVIDRRVHGEFTSADLLRAVAETQALWVETGLMSVAGDKAESRRNNVTARPSKILPRHV